MNSYWVVKKGSPLIYWWSRCYSTWYFWWLHSTYSYIVLPQEQYRTVYDGSFSGECIPNA
jgi:hypothetical protein